MNENNAQEPLEGQSEAIDTNNINPETTTEAQAETENVAVEKTVEEILAEEKDKYIRLYAEFENFKKRSLKEKMDSYKYASQDLMGNMLGVLDDFERALKEINKSEDKALLEGVDLIYNKFKTKLVEKGLNLIEVKAGDTFNVDVHEAITQIPAPTEELKGKIVDVVEPGYQLHDKVIRFAKVVTGA
jgi:molecular chaperone GrpE